MKVLLTHWRLPPANRQQSGRELSVAPMDVMRASADSRPWCLYQMTRSSPHLSQHTTQYPFSRHRASNLKCIDQSSPSTHRHSCPPAMKNPLIYCHHSSSFKNTDVTIMVSRWTFWPSDLRLNMINTSVSHCLYAVFLQGCFGATGRVWSLPSCCCKGEVILLKVEDR